MKIAVAVKVVPEDQDIRVASDRTLDYSGAKASVSTYDLNAIEAAAKLAGEAGAELVAIGAGGKDSADAKVSKNILARGVVEYDVAVDDVFADIDALATGTVLAALVNKVEADLVICGDGSADAYAQQVEVQMAAALNRPVITAVRKLALEGQTLTCERLLESEIEVVQVDLPAVVSVVPDIALPRICGMKDILQAGKKPVNKYSAADLGVDAACGVEVVEVIAPEPMPRKKEIYDAAVDGDVDKFVAALLEAIR